MHTSSYMNKAYYESVGSCCILTQEEERKLLQEYFTCNNCSNLYPNQQGIKSCPTCKAPRNTNARDKIAKANLRFVVKQATKLMHNKTELLDSLISAGNIGLLLAIDRFDITRDTKFLTYADCWIRKEMYDVLLTQSLVRIPVHKLKAIYKQLKQINSEQGSLENREEPEDAVLIKPMMELDPRCSIVRHTDVASDVEQQQLVDTLYRAVHCLSISERDKFILISHFNLARSDRESTCKNLRQIASVVNLRSERVRQVKERHAKQLLRLIEA
jgi:RNA polymerase sigma factor (sigma-70 family)